MGVELDHGSVRDFLIGHAGLRQSRTEASPESAVHALLRDRRCIQIDPLDAIGTNPDLVAMARVDGLRRGDVFRHLYSDPSHCHAFEHFAKERCLLPPSAFPAYRERLPTWRALPKRLARIPVEIREAIYDEVVASGPVTAKDLTDHGRLGPTHATSWHRTGRTSSMALEALWLHGRIVIVGRTGRGKLYDLPERALPTAEAVTPDDPDRWTFVRRVEAAGMMPQATGPWWSMLRAARAEGVIDRALAAGEVESVTVAGSRRTYLAPAGFRDATFPDDDGRMRILGPLDPLIWVRPLIQQVFDFEYLWEVYKPKHLRRWGWYVCPLLHQGRLVGRFEAHVEAGELVVDNLWREPGAAFDESAWRAALDRHQGQL
ncbi:MAG: hypothetical protein ACI9MR_003806 [Myxococcota bacterium]